MDGLLEGSVFAYVSMYALLKDNWAEPMPQYTQRFQVFVLCSLYKKSINYINDFYTAFT